MNNIELETAIVTGAHAVQRSIECISDLAAQHPRVLLHAKHIDRTLFTSGTIKLSNAGPKVVHATNSDNCLDTNYISETLERVQCNLLEARRLLVKLGFYNLQSTEPKYEAKEIPPQENE